MLYFRHLQAYSRLIQPYFVLLKQLKSAGGHIRSILLQAYSKTMHNIYADSSIFRFPAYLGTSCFRHTQPYSQR